MRVPSRSTNTAGESKFFCELIHSLGRCSGACVKRRVMVRRSALCQSGSDRLYNNSSSPKTRNELVARNGGGTELSHDHGAGAVSDLGRFHRVGTAAQGESEQSNRGIAGAGHIEHVPRLCRNVKWFLAFSKQHHSMFAQGDENAPGSPFFEQCFSRAKKIWILRRSFVLPGIQNSCGQKRFAPIRFHDCHPAPLD